MLIPSRPYPPAGFIRLLLVVLIAPLPAFAYLDPVTGSFLVQGLIAGIAAVLASVRSIRERLVRLLFRRGAPPADATPPADPAAGSSPKRQD